MMRCSGNIYRTARNITGMTQEQAAEETGLYWQTVRVMCARGDIKTPRAGRKWILTTKALAKYLDDQHEKESNVVPIRRRQKYEKIV